MKNIICIDGVVGAGKSTIGKILAEELDYKFIEEEVEDNPIIEEYYKDKKKYALLQQLYFLNKKYSLIAELEGDRSYIMDRSIYGDSIFAKMLADDEIMNSLEYMVYQNTLENYMKSLEEPKLMIYLQNSVEDAVKKIYKRGREYEKDVSLKYWERLNTEHESFFEKYKPKNLLIINIDNRDILNNKEDKKWFLGIVKDKLNKKWTKKNSRSCCIIF